MFGNAKVSAVTADQFTLRQERTDEDGGWAKTFRAVANTTAGDRMVDILISYVPADDIDTANTAVFIPEPDSTNIDVTTTIMMAMSGFNWPLVEGEVAWEAMLDQFVTTFNEYLAKGNFLDA